MSQVDLRTKFPTMTPVKSAPKMFLVNGCGLAMRGKREEDAETGTFISTWCVCVLFVPVLCLRAYRVARDGQRWWFLGRDSMSMVAKAWNVLVVVGILGGIGIVQMTAYMASPEYQAKQQMATAEGLVKGGHLAQGAKIYEGLVLRGTPQADAAAGAVKGLLTGGCQTAAPAEEAGVFSAAVAIARQTGKIEAGQITEVGMKLATARGGENPKAFVGVLDAIKPLVLDPRSLNEERLVLLQKWAAAEPGNLEVIVPLAGLMEEKGETGEAKKMLMPVKEKLGDGEGARVLGLILAREGDLEGAYGQLWPYVQKRLGALDGAEKEYDRVMKQVWDEQVADLRGNKAPPSFYKEYEGATEEQKKTLVHEYINKRVRGDGRSIAAEEKLRDVSRVVPVALDLGMIMLQRAQGLPQGAEKQKQMEATEKVFLAIGGIAGESDEYRISLGEVDYWLGKQAEGKALFDEYLKSKGRDFKSLMQVGIQLRELGADTEARALVEEAYGKTSVANEQHAAAMFRSSMRIDADDEILWLKRSDLADPSQKAALSKAMGNKAMEEGREADAVKAYQESIEGYSAVPRSQYTTNEIALAYSGIFAANGDRAAFDRSMDYFEQAVELNPKDTVLLYNAATSLIMGGLTDIAGERADLKVLRCGGSTHLLGYLYQDEAGRKEMAAKVAAHPAIVRACGYLEKAIVLSPKAPRCYEPLFDIYWFTRNEEGLRRLLQLETAANIDHSDQLSEMRKYMAGERDGDLRKSTESELKRSEAVMAEARKKGGVTAAMAMGMHAESLMSAAALGMPEDADAIVALAEEADRTSSSWGTRNTLEGALLYRASTALKEKDAGYRAMMAKYERVLGSAYGVAIATDGGGAVQRLAIENGDVQRAATMNEEDSRRFPESSSVYEWALLRNLDKGEASRLAGVYRQVPCIGLRADVLRVLNPATASGAVDEWWDAHMNGKPDLGEEAMGRLGQIGVALPLGG
ncbi:MAG: hypothetical protein ACTHN5_19305 [Phycisphaerae bacterium]